MHHTFWGWLFIRLGFFRLGRSGGGLLSLFGGGVSLGGSPVPLGNDCSFRRHFQHGSEGAVLRCIASMPDVPIVAGPYKKCWIVSGRGEVGCVEDVVLPDTMGGQNALPVRRNAVLEHWIITRVGHSAFGGTALQGHHEV